MTCVGDDLLVLLPCEVLPLSLVPPTLVCSLLHSNEFTASRDNADQYAQHGCAANGFC